MRPKIALCLVLEQVERFSCPGAAGLIDLSQTDQRAWKEFYRQWRREPGFQWPRPVPFREPHAGVDEAAGRYALPKSPLDDRTRRAALAKAREDAAEILVATDEEWDDSVPPLEVLLP